MSGTPGLPTAGPYRRGLLTSIRNNAAAYGYSVMITSSYGVLSTQLGTPPVFMTLLFALGATVAFLLVEVGSARGLRSCVAAHQMPASTALGHRVGRLPRHPGGSTSQASGLRR